jgi:pimeloyl-ACP methyl ester carboxylesterase
MAIRALGTVSTGAAARLAEALFCRTTRAAPRPTEAAFLARATTDRLRVLGHQIARYRWGPPDAPQVLLVHGWSSHAGRLSLFAEALLARGHQVVAFDGPGHGRSTGWRATMPELARTLRAVVEQTGPVHTVVGHSLGGAATVFALSHGLGAERAVVIAAPVDVTGWAHRFRNALDVDESVYARMRQNLERRLGVSWHDLDLEIAAARLTIPGLVIHDEDDRDVPIEEGERLVRHWPGATLARTSGLGHRRILRDASVVRQVAEFIDRR